VRLFVIAMATMAALASFVAIRPVSVATAGQREVEERLACQCGCGLTVQTCNHLQCSFAIPVRAEIARRLAAGDDDEAIIASYVAEYGEKVLSSPTHEGFNLLAWWGPYAAMAAGMAGLLIALRRMRRAASSAPSPGETFAPDVFSSDSRGQLEKELRDLDA
jgi:cytochrome c-type biogenesis protein CcmH